MQTKPAGLTPEYAEQFKDRSMVGAYHHRPPYPDEVFAILTGLITGGSRSVLDAGSGTGDIARGLAPLVQRVDAVDFSPAMIEKGKQLPGGAHPNLRWIQARVEEAPLSPPYALVTAGESLHWLDWHVALPRFAGVLAPEGYLAIVERRELSSPWYDPLMSIIPRYSTNKHFRPHDLVQELETRSLFVKRGEKKTAPVSVVQTVADYIESIHSRNGFSRDRMPGHDAAAFDAEVAELLSQWSKDGRLEMQVEGRVVWGVPRKQPHG